MASENNFQNLVGIELAEGELARLCWAWCDGTIGAAELEALQSALRSNSENRRRFIALSSIHSDVKAELPAHDSLESLGPFPPADSLSETIAQSKPIVESLGHGVGEPAKSAPATIKFETPTKFENWLGWLGNRKAWAAILVVGLAGWAVAVAAQQFLMAHRAGSDQHFASSNNPKENNSAEKSEGEKATKPEHDVVSSNGKNNSNPKVIDDSNSGSPLQPVAANRGPVLARVTEQTTDCQWYFDHGGKSLNAGNPAESVANDPADANKHNAAVHPEAAPTNTICSGDTLRVTSGVLKLVFDNETVVTLHAPAIFEVFTDMRARVVLGKVTAKIGPTAKGFSVVTPQATVVDLGTEFGITVNEVGATDVVVFKGMVDLDYSKLTEGSAKQRLTTGEGVHLDTSGTPSRIVSITDQLFADEPAPKSLRPPVITEVRDNIQREQGSWNYYEIVQAGMAEDAKAYVDREAHEWNGVTTAGMPSYLLGGDYVKTFNNDKIKHDIEITVTLDRPAKLYVLFEDRIPPPAWLKEQFRNTGDKIGIDEGPFIVNGKWRTEHQPDVGPGVSIDHTATIWVRDVKTPGPVHLGATETPIPNINMYGIVAVPMDEKTHPLPRAKNSTTTPSSQTSAAETKQNAKPISSAAKQ